MSDRFPERIDVHVHHHFGPVAEAGSMLVMLLGKLLERINVMPTIDDLNNAVTGVQGVLTANDARVAALATAVSDSAARSAAHDAALDAQIQTLQAQIAAGTIDPAALQPAVDQLAALSTQAVAEGTALDAATSALAAAFPPAPPAPAPAP